MALPTPSILEVFLFSIAVRCEMFGEHWTWPSFTLHELPFPIQTPGNMSPSPPNRSRQMPKLCVRVHEAAIHEVLLLLHNKMVIAFQSCHRSMSECYSSICPMMTSTTSSVTREFFQNPNFLFPRHPASSRALSNRGNYSHMIAWGVTPLCPKKDYHWSGPLCVHTNMGR